MDHDDPHPDRRATTNATTDSWDPSTYHRFAAERSAPFYDLVGLCAPVPGGRAVDLGCGSGELTAALHRRLQPARTTGLDNSPAMLAEAGAVHETGVEFAAADISQFGAAGGDTRTYDLAFSNAALQWVARDHREVIAQWCSTLRPGGQLAVQVPSNADHASHLTLAEVAREEPFLSALDGAPPPDPVRGVLRPEEYAEALFTLGFREQHVRLQVYGHVLPSTASVVEWLSGTSLTRFRSRLDAATYSALVDRYRQRLLDVLGDHEPYFYAFKRVLMWGRLDPA